MKKLPKHKKISQVTHILFLKIQSKNCLGAVIMGTDWDALD